MDKNEVIFCAFKKACKYMREHPPCDAGWEGDMEIICCVADGKSDPEGERWMLYFINKVLDDMGVSK